MSFFLKYIEPVIAQMLTHNLWGTEGCSITGSHETIDLGPVLETHPFGNGKYFWSLTAIPTDKDRYSLVEYSRERGVEKDEIRAIKGGQAFTHQQIVEIFCAAERELSQVAGYVVGAKPENYFLDVRPPNVRNWMLGEAKPS